MVVERRLRGPIFGDRIEFPERRQALVEPLRNPGGSRIARKSREPLLPGIFFPLVLGQGVQLVGREA
jgi:hypothetical protein